MTRGATEIPDAVVITETARLAGDSVSRLCAVMDVLRSPGGCAWDAVQTHETLVEYLIEETYEVIDAIDAEDDESLCEELGDLLLQVVFHARLAEERPADPWGLAVVADAITAKLVSRHPHVFAAAEAPDAVAAEASWQARKSREKRRKSALDGVPLAMPALSLAAKLTRRAARAGSEVVPGGPNAQAAAQAAIDRMSTDPNGPSVGDFLLALVARCEQDGLDLDRELRRAIGAFREQVVAAEKVGGGSDRDSGGDSGGDSDKSSGDGSGGDDRISEPEL